MSEEQREPDEAIDYIDRLEATLGANRDTEGLGTMKVGPCVVGGIGAIYGEDGEEAPEFVPTIYELKQLASYWMEEEIDQEYVWFVFGTSGSREWRWNVFIARRLNRLAEILGKEAMQLIHKYALESYQKGHQIDDEEWRAFTTGTEEEQDARGTKLDDIQQEG
jgi:hypothetical protein